MNRDTHRVAWLPFIFDCFLIIHDVDDWVGVLGSNSSLFAFLSPSTFRAKSITAICIPRHRPSRVDCFHGSIWMPKSCPRFLGHQNHQEQVYHLNLLDAIPGHHAQYPLHQYERLRLHNHFGFRHGPRIHLRKIRILKIHVFSNHTNPDFMLGV